MLPRQPEVKFNFSAIRTQVHKAGFLKIACLYLFSTLGGTTGPFDNYASAKAVFDSELHFKRVQQFVQANK